MKMVWIFWATVAPFSWLTWYASVGIPGSASVLPHRCALRLQARVACLVGGGHVRRYRGAADDCVLRSAGQSKGPG
jgi:hypothetical protein